jgi:OOP family OmpA-OmpF porin
MIKQITAATLLAVASFAASAAEPTQSQYYVGGDVGSTKFDESPSETSVGIFAGYKFDETFAVEANYRRLGKWDVEGFDVKANQVGISLIASAPVADQFSVYGRLGYNRVELKAAGEKDHDNKAVYGIGVSYAISKELTARLEWQRPYDDTRNISVGVAYHF